MAAGIAHELNTPLTYIMGNLELLQAQPLPDAQQEMLRSIARGRGAHQEPGPEPARLQPARPGGAGRRSTLNDVIERSLELCHYQILKGGVQLEKELAAGPARRSAGCPTSSRWPSSTWS